MNKNKYLILPECYDLNRGDQALVWETIRLAKDAGFDGEFYIQTEPSISKQSIAKGYKCFTPILKHPSRNKKTDNISYGLYTKLRWGIVAIVDLIRTLLILLIAKSDKLCKCLLSTKTQKELNNYKTSDAVFVKGGGFIHSYGSITTPYYLYFHLFPIYLAKRLGKKIYIMPNSFGPIDGFSAKWQVRKALKGCTLIFCRESISCQYMKKTFPEIPFKLSDDLAFYLKPSIDIISTNYKNKKKVAITVRPYRFPEHNNSEELYKKYVESVRCLAKYVYDKGYFPIFVQHTLAINSHEDDIKCITTITKGLTTGQYGIIENASYNCEDMKKLYSDFDIIIGTRFHSVIFSLASGVPAIAIAYGGNKSRGIMRDNNLEKYVIDIDKVDNNNLISLFDYLVDHYEEYKNLLSLMNNRIETNRAEIVECLRNTYENSDFVS